MVGDRPNIRSAPVMEFSEGTPDQIFDFGQLLQA